MEHIKPETLSNQITTKVFQALNTGKHVNATTEGSTIRYNKKIDTACLVREENCKKHKKNVQTTLKSCLTLMK